MPIEVVEWPGGEPSPIDLEVTPEICHAVKTGRKTVPLGTPPDLAAVAGLPWCSLATLHAAGERLQRLVGPAIFQTTGWALPVLGAGMDAATGLGEYVQEAERRRGGWGLNSAHS